MKILKLLGLWTLCSICSLHGYGYEGPPTEGEWSALNAKVQQQQQTSDRLARELKQVKERQNDIQARLPREARRLDQKIQEVGTMADQSTRKLGTMEGQLSSRFLITGICIAVVAMGALLVFFVLRRRGDGFDVRIAESRRILDQEMIKLDEKLVDLMGNQMRLATPAIPPPTAPNSEGQAKVDHSLALRVGEEIYRMRNRLGSLPEDTKGLRPLMKSLERLEEDLIKQGYELLDLLNKNYSESMNAKVRFIPSNELGPGQQVITRVIKPPILFHGEVIEAPELEVSTGG